eukprot:GFKZ01010832.1.p1 GENE.GFKZ01010832.1~~GFKZ01010832.1.p1  ORF type:complete len:414 (+),score=59.20 GFKZ01010832.1:504-1745(+)
MQKPFSPRLRKISPRLPRLLPRDILLVLTTALLTLFITFLTNSIKSLSPPTTPNSPNQTPLLRSLLESTANPPPSQTEVPHAANLAYFIQIAESTASHLPRLLSRLYHPANVYAIHFDSKMPDPLVANITRQIFAINPKYKRNVHIMPSELITYRGVSMVLNTINAMKFLLEHNQDWHYFINLSGSDYPLVSTAQQRELLGRHLDRNFNFISMAKPQRWEQNIAYRMDHFYVDEALSFTDQPSQVVQIPFLNPLARMMNFRYVNSEAWMINSRDFCRFLVTDGYARKMLLTFSFSVEPSEHYFSTVLWNHPKYNKTIVPRALRHVIWTHEGEDAGQHPFYVDERLDGGEFRFRKVAEDSPNFFIRKFKTPDSPLMDIIDGRLDDPTHVDAVTKLYTWITSVAIDQNNLDKDNA